jgi:hypothetical protein
LFANGEEISKAVVRTDGRCFVGVVLHLLFRSEEQVFDWRRLLTKEKTKAQIC